MVMTGKVFRNCFAAPLQKMAFLIDECIVNVDNNGVHVHVIDSSHVAMCKFAFSRFECIEYASPNVISTGFDLAGFCKLAALVPNNNEHIAVEFTADAIKFAGFTLKCKDVKRDLKEAELLASFEDVLQDKWTQGATVLSGIMQALVKNGMVISDLCQLATNGDNLVFSCTDNDAEFSSIVESERFLSHNTAHGIYNLNFLNAFVKTSPLASKGRAALNVEYIVKLGQDVPMLLQEMIGNESKLTWMLAPRIQDTNDEEEEEVDPIETDPDEVDPFPIDDIDDGVVARPIECITQPTTTAPAQTSPPDTFYMTPSGPVDHDGNNLDW